MVPAMVILANFPLIKATGTSLAAILLPVGILGVIAYYRARLIDIRGSILIAVGLVISVVIGAWLAHTLPASLVQKLYAIFCLYVSWTFIEPVEKFKRYFGHKNKREKGKAPGEAGSEDTSKAGPASAATGTEVMASTSGKKNASDVLNVSDELDARAAPTTPSSLFGASFSASALVGETGETIESAASSRAAAPAAGGAKSVDEVVVAVAAVPTGPLPSPASAVSTAASSPRASVSALAAESANPHPHFMALIGVGLLAGIMSGMFGVGGGNIIVPFLILFLHYPAKRAIATSLAALLAPVGLPGVIYYYKAGTLDLKVAGLLAVGLVMGTVVGARVNIRISGDLVKVLYGIFLIFVAARFLFF